MSITVHQVLNLTELELEHATSIHVRAYAMKDPAIKMMLGGNWSLAADLGRAMIRAVLLAGEVYAVKNEENEIVSFGLWTRPGATTFSTEEQKALGFNAFFEKLNGSVTETVSKYPKTIARYGDPMFTKEEVSKRWWCSNLVTDPDYQGRGYATAIVQHGLKKAMEADGFIGLIATSPVNLRRYLAMGLRKRGDFLVPSPAVGDPDLKVHVLSKEM
uniref:N-acetyltransferase domain-containing protein n=1 Tax=Moniliophthora roreri TaxID=221103 RepID=A0A0W0G5G1_MONRR